MSAPVDVLAVMDARRLDWRDWCSYLAEADKARAAVAELIAAANAVACDEANRGITVVRLITAIAGCKGGAA